MLEVPDELFFNEKGVDVDLSRIYSSSKKNKEKVYGIIDILNSYKFTVAENTPIEEEIALDPELLGKVFENLLANYNPETQTTARKQTGSFYTPREIVNYMVDESLLAYLKQSLSSCHDVPSVVPSQPVILSPFVILSGAKNLTTPTKTKKDYATCSVILKTPIPSILRKPGFLLRRLIPVRF